jgi:hypothetical protein
MAKVTVTKTPIPRPVHEVKVTLELSAEEAVALLTLTTVVGGKPATSLRQYIMDIATALEEAGVTSECEHVRDTLMRDDSRVWFNDHTKTHERFTKHVEAIRS